MTEVIDHLKSRARKLHQQFEARDPEAVRRLQTLPEFAKQDPASFAEQVKRRHCLTVIARELGFTGWQHLTGVLWGESVEDFGTLLYPGGGTAYWNIWSARYEEARQIREEHGGYLLAYKKHMFIVDRHFIESLGLDPEDADWDRMGRDWVRPKDLTARQRLYGKLIVKS
jgi:hypothetical protein